MHFAVVLHFTKFKLYILKVLAPLKFATSPLPTYPKNIGIYMRDRFVEGNKSQFWTCRRPSWPLGPLLLTSLARLKRCTSWGTTEVELQLSSFEAVWAKRDEAERFKFHGRWCYTVATSPLLVTERLRSPFHVEFSGLGGSHVLDAPYLADLFVKCMTSAPCYCP